EPARSLVDLGRRVQSRVAAGARVPHAADRPRQGHVPAPAGNGHRPGADPVMNLVHVLAEGGPVLADAPSQLLPAREQMAFTLMVHVILVPFGVALPFITLVMNYLGLRRGDAVAMQLARRWTTVMAIQFAVGAVTGTVISLEFGLLWPGLMGKWGDVIGIAFGIEGWAFFLEAILVAIYIYGWKRMSPRAHFLVGLPIPLVALVGAFSILSVNAWMNTPQGFELDKAGNPTNVDITQVLFTPILAPQYLHMIAAAYMVAGYLVAS